MDSRLSTIIHNIWHEQNDWRRRIAAPENIEAAVYQAMEVFVIFMVAFFFVFLYYCAFGFVVGSITELNVDKGEKEE
ncbi:hypothetical protein H2198_009981, partial [Neophaeococcomyces mojaviensis]